MGCWWHRLVIPARRVWIALSSRILKTSPKNGGDGLLKLHDDIQMCGYEDVQVMWEMLRRYESESLEAAQLASSKRRSSSSSSKHLKFIWTIFRWSSHHRHHQGNDTLLPPKPRPKPMPMPTLTPTPSHHQTNAANTAASALTTSNFP